MYVADSKRLTHAGARKMMDAALDKARAAGIAISCAIADAGGHLVVLERMDGGRFHTLHSSTTKAVCAASNRRQTGAKGAAGQDLDVTHVLGLALAAGPERWTAMEGGVPIIVDGECIGGVGVSGGDWETDLRIAQAAVESIGASWKRCRGANPVRVASIGMGWWSDVLADAIKRSGKLKIVACYTRSADKRDAFAAKYDCKSLARYEDMLADPDVEAIINTTPNDAHLETTSAAAAAGKHVFLDKPIANSIADGRAITACCAKAGVVLALGYQRRRESHFRWIRKQIDAGVFGKLVNAEANISRDRLGKIDLSSWRYQAAGMPGGVMLQIGIHYIDVLEYLIGPIKAVRGQSAQLVLPGDNPDVASLILEHENGALSTLNASYASASEYYLMNIYGKEATAYYDLHRGLWWLRRGEEQAIAGSVAGKRHARRGAGGIRRCRARQRRAGNRRRLRNEFARCRARRNSVGARRTPGRNRGDTSTRD